MLVRLLCYNGYVTSFAGENGVHLTYMKSNHFNKNAFRDSFSHVEYNNDILILLGSLVGSGRLL